MSRSGLALLQSPLCCAEQWSVPCPERPGQFLTPNSRWRMIEHFSVHTDGILRLSLRPRPMSDLFLGESVLPYAIKVHRDALSTWAYFSPIRKAPSRRKEKLPHLGRMQWMGVTLLSCHLIPGACLKGTAGREHSSIPGSSASLALTGDAACLNCALCLLFVRCGILQW